jgi:hypothetical protein
MSAISKLPILGKLFSGIGGEPVTMPDVPAPPAIPVVDDETGDEAISSARKRSGYQKTIITGALEPKPTGKKTVLG